MSWLRTAMNKAVEVGNKNITRTVKNYADSVVQQAGHAVAEGAKLLQDRIGVRNFKSVKQTIGRLEEAAISCRGAERALLLRRWLIVLKEIHKLYGASTEDKHASLEELLAADEAKRQALVLYHDEDAGGEPLNFRDVFLQSQALEGVTLSMILEAPNDDEIVLLLEIFGLCLTGGKEVHHAIISSIQDLASVFSSYQDEVLVKREELLQFAQSAITGLKINAEILRIDAEAADLRRKLDGMAETEFPHEGEDKASQQAPIAIEALKQALAKIRACSRLEGLLHRKRQLTNGDSPEVHAQKVDKLKILSESLANSTSKAEKRISENRLQKEEALKVRVVKANEVTDKEKELNAEISQLETQRDSLEAELKKVKISLAAAQARLHDAREERDQFDEANNQIIAHFKTKDEDLSKSVKACKVEAEVLNSWIKFLEDAWVLQSSYLEMKDKQASDELEKHEDYFLKAATSLLSSYKNELAPSIVHLEKYLENLKNLGAGSDKASESGHEETQGLNPRKHLEEEYLDYEAKMITTFSVVDNMKEQLYAHQSISERKDDPSIKELFEDIEKLRQKFESIERPMLEIETQSPKSSPASPKSKPSSPKPGPASPKSKPSSPKPGPASPKSKSSSPKTSPASSKTPENPPIMEKTKEAGTGEGSNSNNDGAEQPFTTEAEFAKLESECGKTGKDYSADEIDGWEFDELEKELQSSDSATNK